MKWIITGLAVWWAYSRLRRMFSLPPSPASPPRERPETTVRVRRPVEEDGEYVEYEEVKE
ncbi:MAG: hypothetical protein SFV52_13540 [Saprospiraceae bacterium]|nr:hypothetical protein [Saprospiraceae bacterium]